MTVRNTGANTITLDANAAFETPGGTDVALAAGQSIEVVSDGTLWRLTLMLATSGGVSDGDKGDVTVSASGTAWAVDTGVVTLGELGTGTLAELNTVVTDANLVPDARTLTVAGTSNEITSSAGAQDLSTNRTWTLSLPASLDLGGKAVEIPNSGTLPASCTVGQMYMDTDATSGQRFYLCQATDTWAVQGDGGGAGISDGDKGDITVSSSGTAWALDADVVTYAKLQDVSATDRLLGRDTPARGMSKRLRLPTPKPCSRLPVRTSPMRAGAAP